MLIGALAPGAQRLGTAGVVRVHRGDPQVFAALFLVLAERGSVCSHSDPHERVSHPDRGTGQRADARPARHEDRAAGGGPAPAPAAAPFATAREGGPGCVTHPREAEWDLVCSLRKCCTWLQAAFTFLPSVTVLSVFLHRRRTHVPSVCRLPDMLDVLACSVTFNCHTCSWSWVSTSPPLQLRRPPSERWGVAREPRPEQLPQ